MVTDSKIKRDSSNKNYSCVVLGQPGLVTSPWEGQVLCFSSWFVVQGVVLSAKRRQCWAAHGNGDNGYLGNSWAFLIASRSTHCTAKQSGLEKCGTCRCDSEVYGAGLICMDRHWNFCFCNDIWNSQWVVRKKNEPKAWGWDSYQMLMKITISELQWILRNRDRGA